MTEVPVRTRGKVLGARPTWLRAQLVGLRSETRTARTLTFTCGMGMFKSAVVIR